MRNILMLAVFLSACGLHQDPFDGQPDNVKNAVPPEVKQEEKGIPQDFAVLDVPSYLYFTEGRETLVNLSARVFVQNSGYQISIDNLPQGASFNAKTGELKWQPPQGFIKGATRSTFDLDISLVVNAKQVLRMTKSIFVVVEKQFAVPSLTASTAYFKVREGSNLDFDVMVSDPDSDGTKVPDLVPRRMSQYKGSNFVKVLSQDFQAGKWVFHLRLDLQGEEVTASSAIADFQLVAYSVLGIPSAPLTIEVDVTSNATMPSSSWLEGNKVEMIAGKNSYVFTVFDPKAEGIVTLAAITDFSKLPNAPTLACTADASGRICTINWMVPDIDVSKLTKKEVELVFQVNNNVQGDQKSVQLKRYVIVPVAK